MANTPQIKSTFWNNTDAKPIVQNSWTAGTAQASAQPQTDGSVKTTFANVTPATPVAPVPTTQATPETPQVPNVPTTPTTTTPQKTGKKSVVPKWVTTPSTPPIPSTPETKTPPTPTQTQSSGDPVKDWVNAGGNRADFEKIIEDRYGTVATYDKATDSYTAEVNGKSYKWAFDANNNPIKTENQIAVKPTDDELLSRFQTWLDQNINRNVLVDMVKNNPHLKDQFGAMYANYKKNKKTDSDIKLIQSMDEKQIYESIKNGKFTTKWEAFNWLKTNDPEKYAKYQEYAKIQFGIDVTKDEPIVWDSFTWMDFNAIYKDVLTTWTDFKKEVENILNAQELQDAKALMSEKRKNLLDLQTKYKQTADDIRAKYPNQSESWVNAMVSKEQGAIMKQLELAQDDYQLEVENYNILQWEAKQKIDAMTLDATQKQQAFATALNIYNSNRARMDLKEQRDFEKESQKIAEERQFEYTKKLAEFQQEMADKNLTGWQYIDDGKWNLNYVYKWEVKKVLTGLGKKISTSEDDLYTYNTYKNDITWGYDVIGVNKKTGNVTHKALWVDGTNPNQSNYISYIWNGKITSYGGTHDGYSGLDIDGNVWDPIPVPATVKVVQAQSHKQYGNTVVVEVQDWPYAGYQIRYSHLNKGANYNIGDVLNPWDVIGEIWNTWYVLNSQWQVPTAKELASWTGSHLDLVMYDKNWQKLNSHQVESIASDMIQWVWQSQKYDDGKLALMASITSLTPTTKKALFEAGLTAEDWAKFNDWQLPPTESQYKQAENIISKIDNFMTHPWFNGAVWASLSKWNGAWLPWSDTQSFINSFNSFIANLVLPNLWQLKWPMSDKDIQFLKDTATSVQLSDSEDEFIRKLAELKQKYKIILNKRK